MSKVKFRSAYDVPLKVTFKCEGSSRTKQSFKNDCDVNNILRKYNNAGLLPQFIDEGNKAFQSGLFGDFSEVPDFLDAVNVVQRAEEQFAALSSRVRERFVNDPSKFLAFVSDPRNAAELASLGLTNAPVGASGTRDLSSNRESPAVGEGPKT